MISDISKVLTAYNSKGSTSTLTKNINIVNNQIKNDKLFPCFFDTKLCFIMYGKHILFVTRKHTYSTGTHLDRSVLSVLL